MFSSDSVIFGISFLTTILFACCSSQCIADNGTCKADGSLGYCCSDICLQIAGETSGYCLQRSKEIVRSTQPTPKPESDPSCIQDKMKCHEDGSLGNCCSGNCFQSGGKPSGFCMDKPISECLENNEECHYSGSLGFCCTGFCDQDISQALGSCKIKNSTNGSSGKGKPMSESSNGGSVGSSSNSSNIIAIVFGSITVILLGGIVVIGIIRMQRKKSVLTAKDIREFLEGIPDLRNRPDNQYAQQNTDVVPYDKDFEVPDKDYQIDQERVLGSGAFGIVFGCVVRGVPVAAKTTSPDADVSYVKALLSELKVMIHIGKHQNVVNLIGASTSNLKSGSVFIFVELCTNGSLEEYLRSHRGKFVNQLSSEGSTHYANVQVNIVEPGWISSHELLIWSIQIANGMAYLAEKKVIHADLSTRNVLLTDRLTAKITDFGLSRKLYDYTNYVKKKQEPLPWRWMAIESLRDLTFSTQSDVWSYGITIWEIFSLGSIPYPGLNWSADFVDILSSNMRPARPPHAMESVFNLMTQCWHFDPASRPSFEELSTKLTVISNTIKNSSGYYLQF